jgi:hypothetical protein
LVRIDTDNTFVNNMYNVPPDVIPMPKVIARLENVYDPSLGLYRIDAPPEYD